MPAPTETRRNRIPLEAFTTGITDAVTYNKAMELLDELLDGKGDGHWKPPVANFGALPLTGNDVGDVRLVIGTMTLYAWNGAAWAALGGGGGGVYAGSFEQPAKPTVVQIPDGWWGYWWDTGFNRMWHVRNRGGTMYAVRLTPLP